MFIVLMKSQKVKNIDWFWQNEMMTHNPVSFQRKINLQSQTLQEVENLKYQGQNISNEGSKSELLSRTAQIKAALSKRQVTGKDKNIY